MRLQIFPLVCIVIMVHVPGSKSATASNTGVAEDQSIVSKRSFPLYFSPEMGSFPLPSPVESGVPAFRNSNNYVPPYMAEPGSFPVSTLVTYYTNCQYLGLTTTYSVQLQSDDPITCGNILCGTDAKCTHFSWLGPVPGRTRGICSLRSAPRTGGDWYSAFLLPTQSVCGFIPKRANVPEIPTPPTEAPPTEPPTTVAPSELTASCESNCDGMCFGDDEIRTPNYPLAYPPNLFCTFTLTASEPTAFVSLGISSISLSSDFDMLRVFDSNQTVLFLYPGETVPAFMTELHSISGVFISASDVQRKKVKQSAIGLAARFFASVEVPETPEEFTTTPMPTPEPTLEPSSVPSPEPMPEQTLEAAEVERRLRG